MSPVPDKEAWAVNALSLSWEDLDTYAFPPTALIASVINKILSHNSIRMAQHVVFTSSQPCDTAIQLEPSQRPSPSESPCLTPRASINLVVGHQLG